MNGEKDSSVNIFRLIQKPEYAMLLLLSFFGLAFVFVTPPALVGDEPNHFFRAYQISEGIVIGEKREHLSGGWLPKSVLYTNRKLVGNIEMRHDVKFDTKLFSELRQLSLNSEDRVFERFPNTVVYTPIPYVPQVLGIIVGKIFDTSPLTMIYLARIFNLLCFIALAFAAIKKTPIHKWVFCLLCLTPTNVFQVASASVDAFTFGICFLAIAHFLFYAVSENVELKTTDIVKLFALSLLAVMSKNAYIFLPLLFLLTPYRKIGTVKKYLITFSALLIVCIGSVAAWTRAVKPIFLPYRVDIPINPDEQMQLIINHPFLFTRLAVFDYVGKYDYYFVSFFGQLTWLDLYVPTYLTIFIFIVIMTVSLLDKNADVSISKLNKTLFAFIIFATALLISVLLYMTWTPLDAFDIEGIQGRYFIPVAPLLFLLFYNRQLDWKNFGKYVYPVVYLTVFISLAVTLHSIIKRYYI
jgi:uncharacterized membrane protein